MAARKDDDVAIPWPHKNDRLFRKGGDRNLAASAIPELGAAATGYKIAADILVAQLKASSREDSLFFPIVFCYRHYIELRLKAITQSISWFTGEDVKYVHGLRKLWEPLRNQLAAEIDVEESDALAAVDACISELDEVDPDPGTVFRYPEFSNMAPSALQVDLGNLAEVMGRLSMFLDALEDSWGHL